MARHTLSHADQLFWGDAQFGPYQNALRGIRFHPVMLMDLGTPIVADPDGIAAAQAVAGAGNLTLNGALSSGGVAVLDVPRTIEIDSTAAGDTSQTATVTGTDLYGRPMTEVIAFNGTTAVAGQKAFKTVTQIAISAAMAGNANAGTTNVLGLPFRVDAGNVLQWIENNLPHVGTLGTFAAADATSPATTTTNDVRGTYLPNTTPNGSVQFKCWAYVDPSSKVSAFGVDQA
jgi:hypothetical protein